MEMDFLPLSFQNLTLEMEEKAYTKLGETPQIKKKALEELKRLIKQEPNFEPVMDDIFLLAFLRHKKYDVKKTFKILCNFYAMKKKYSRILTDFKPSELKPVLEMNQLTVQPFRCSDGCSIGIWRMGDHNFETTALEELTATIMTMGLMLIHIEASQVCGLVMIWDWKNLSFLEFKKISLYRAAQYAFDILGCTPFRLKSLHIVNTPSFFSIFYNIIKVLFPKKLVNRVFVHGSDLTELHKHVSPELLPEELGGTLGPLNNQEYMEYFLSQEDYIEQINNSGIK